MQSEQIWVVIRGNGEYENYFESPVMAFTEEAKAKHFVAELETHGVNIRKLINEIVGPPSREKYHQIEALLKRPNPLDAQSDAETQFSYYEVTLCR